MITLWNSFWRNEDGNAVMELAFTSIFLVIAFAGMMELTSFIDAKQRVNKAANQVAMVLSSMNRATYTASKDKPEIDKILEVGANTALPQNIRVRAKFCRGGTNKGTTAIQSRAYNCGFGQTTSGSSATSLACDQSGPGFQEYVVVKAYCSYQPFITLLGLFDQGFRIDGDITVPMRKDMGW